MKVAIGIDIGGTNSKYGLVDTEGNVLMDDAIKTEDYPFFEDFVDQMTHALKDMVKKAGNVELTGVGIGAPNGNFYTGTIEQAPNLAWKGVVPLQSRFEKTMGVPVKVTNDANAAALGEMMYGGAKGMSDFIMITLGTGLGSGIVSSGHMVYGHDGFAGELGHLRVKLNGRVCGCGRRGCLETYVSATGLKRTVYKLISDSLYESNLRTVPFSELEAKHVTKAADKGDKIALEAFEYTGKILGQSLADFVAFSSPEAIFLFGGLAKAGHYIFEPTRRHYEENVLPIYRHKVKILPSELPESTAAIMGASALIWKELDV